MARRVPAFLACFILAALLAGCEVPKPPPEIPTATPGSQNPENPAFRGDLTPVRVTLEPGFTPLAVPPGHIYFVRASALWRVAPDGSGEMRLSDLPVTGPPQPSPDGKQIAWLSGQDLYVMPSTGGTPMKLFSGDLAEGQRLGWTHDSSMVGFITYDKSIVRREIAWAVPAAGGEPVAITAISQGGVGRGAAYERSVQWSPDGRWVVIGGANNPLWLLRWPLSTTNGGDSRDIPGGEPDWSPDGRDLVYAETLNGALVIYVVLSSEATPFRNEQQLVGTGVGQYAQGPGPRWSPASNGSEDDLIAYRSRTPAGEPRVSIRRRGGRDLAPLPSFTNNPSWSPSGDRLVVETGYLKGEALGPRWVANGLSIADVSFGGEHKVTALTQDAQWPAWGK